MGHEIFYMTTNYCNGKKLFSGFVGHAIRTTKL